jgi:hypothetical protein
MGITDEVRDLSMVAKEAVLGKTKGGMTMRHEIAMAGMKEAQWG